MSTRTWARRQVFFLSMTLGICCVIEFVLQFFGGTDYHLRVTPRTYKIILAIAAPVFFVVAWLSRPRRAQT